MKIYKIEFEKAAIKFLEKQDKTQRLRIYKAIYKLPEGTDIKKLQGYNLYRLRVGNYRILYSIDDTVKIITIENIDNTNILTFPNIKYAITAKIIDITIQYNINLQINAQVIFPEVFNSFSIVYPP